jgi:hypothetical protein
MLVVPETRIGSIYSIAPGKQIVFRCDGNDLQGLQYSIIGDFFGIPAVIVDNHNAIVPHLFRAKEC